MSLTGPTLHLVEDDETISLDRDFYAAQHRGVSGNTATKGSKRHRDWPWSLFADDIISI